jgi:hypothetical protein
MLKVSKRLPIVLLLNIICGTLPACVKKIKIIKFAKMRATNQRRLQTQKPSRRPVMRGSGDDPGHRRGPGKHGRIFLPGQPVPETGIYEVMHDRAHRVAHEAVMHREDLFPVCDQCDTRVRFKLIRTAPYIFDDEDFVDEK